jgi:hypothetical protein
MTTRPIAGPSKPLQRNRFAIDGGIQFALHPKATPMILLTSQELDQ